MGNGIDYGHLMLDLHQLRQEPDQTLFRICSCVCLSKSAWAVSRTLNDLIRRLISLVMILMK